MSIDSTQFWYDDSSSRMSSNFQLIIHIFAIKKQFSQRQKVEDTYEG